MLACHIVWPLDLMLERFKERGFPKYFFWALEHSLTANAKKKKKGRQADREVAQPLVSKLLFLMPDRQKIKRQRRIFS